MPRSCCESFAGAARRGIEAAIVWIDDYRRVLPRFIKRPLRRVPSGGLLIGLLVLVAIVFLTILLLATGGSDAPTSTAPEASASVVLPAPPYLESNR